jgi:predicted DNA-binding ribbon-helix-helix protein
MRTTVDLPDDVFRQLKSMAAQRGTSMKQLLRTAVEKELSTDHNHNHEYRVTLPILDSKEPGTLNLTNADIEELLT